VPKISRVCFVNDTDLIVTASDYQAATVANHMQVAVAEWEELLSTTGGSLVPGKCFWYLVNFEFQGSKWNYLGIYKQVQLKVRNAQGDLTNIPQLPVMEARRTLGVRVAPDGNNAAKFDHLIQIATEWYMVMKEDRLTHEADAFSVHNVILKQLTYPLVTMTFTGKECMAIMQPILVAGLPAMGIVRTMAQVVVHGPLCYQGLDIPNLYMEQLLAQLQALLQYSQQAKDVTGSLICYMAEAF